MAESENPDAQWPVMLDKKCELCEINNITFKCLNCDEMICDTCKKLHLKSKASKDHKMVCLQSAEIYENNQMVKKCPNHTKEDMLMYCNACCCPICRECISSGVHLHHPMVKVEEVIDTKQKELSNIIAETNKKSKRYKDVVKTITLNNLKFSQSITKKIKEIKERNNYLKSRLDKMESDLIQQLQKIDKENKKAMTDLEQRLQEEMSNLNQLIQQCERKQRERNTEMVQFVTDVKQRLDKYRSCDPPDPAHPPDLITRHVDDQELVEIFGHLDIKTIQKLKQPLPMKSPVIDAQIVGCFNINKDRVVTTSSDQAWLWCFRNQGISLMTSDGKVIQDISTDFEVYDAAVSTSGDLLVTVHSGNKVKKLTQHKTFIDIYAAEDGYSTQCITITGTGNVLVKLWSYLNRKIVEITTSGQLIRTIQYDTINKNLLSYNLTFICTNINGDILVTDRRTVVVVNQQGQRRFTYQGEGTEIQKRFFPQAIVTDKYGHIIISDSYNNVIHVLDVDGKFIQYLITPEHRCDTPRGLALDSHGKLWVCNTEREQITIIKYV